MLFGTVALMIILWLIHLKVMRTEPEEDHVCREHGAGACARSRAAKQLWTFRSVLWASCLIGKMTGLPLVYLPRCLPFLASCGPSARSLLAFFLSKIAQNSSSEEHNYISIQFILFSTYFSKCYRHFLKNKDH